MIQHRTMKPSPIMSEGRHASAHTSKIASRSLLKCTTTLDGDVRTFHNDASSEHPSNGTNKKSSSRRSSTTIMSSGSSSSSSNSYPAKQNQIPSAEESKEGLSAKNPRHSRNLSAHFYDATRINEASSGGNIGVPRTGASHNADAYRGNRSTFPTQHAPKRQSTEQIPSVSSTRPNPSTVDGHKRSRASSGDLTSPAVFHRRINSSGNSAPVHGNTYSQSFHHGGGTPPLDPSALSSRLSSQHQRNTSAGLDMLTAAVLDLSKEELAAAAGKSDRRTSSKAWDNPVVPPARRERPEKPLAPVQGPRNSNSTSYTYPSQQPSHAPHAQHHGYSPQSHQYPPHGHGYPGSMAPPPAHTVYPPPLHGQYPGAPTQQQPLSHAHHTHGPHPPHPNAPYYHPSPLPQHGHHLPQHYQQHGPSPPMAYPPHPNAGYPVQYSQTPRGNASDPRKSPQPPHHPTSTSEPPYERIDTDEHLFVKRSPAEPPHGGARRPKMTPQHSHGGARRGKTTGVQTHVTAISVGNGENKVMQLTAPRRNTNLNFGATANENNNVPSAVPTGHHRKMSSFSSLGFALFNDGYEAPPLHAPAHHKTSSTTSFLNGLDDGDGFFQNLAGPPPSNMGPHAPPLENHASSSFAPPSGPAYEAAYATGGMHLPRQGLAEGGTSKRVRRKCTIAGCDNRVVQGGLCIAHGARRKQCMHPGCSKNVKKAGLCSSHGPARKRCNIDNCNKVAVQGGRCIAHGAKKKLCDIENCTKQAILEGMCKKHHDQTESSVSTHQIDMEQKTPSPEGSRADSTKVVESSGVAFAEPRETSAQRPVRPSSTLLKPGHKRGLSIFQEMSAESVKSLLSHDEKGGAATPPMHQSFSGESTAREGSGFDLY